MNGFTMKIFKYAVLVVLTLSLFFLPEADKVYLFLQSVNSMAREWFESRTPSREGRGKEAAERKRVRIVRLDSLSVEAPALKRGPAKNAGGGEGLSGRVERELRHALVLHENVTFVDPGGGAWALVDGQVAPVPAPPPGAAGTVRLSCRAIMGEEAGSLVVDAGGEGGPLRLSRDYFKWYAVLPPFVAILLALLFQKTILALFCGIWLGATLLAGGDPFAGLWLFAGHYLYKQALVDQFRLEIIGFVVALCAMVGVLSRGGGIRGFVNLLVRFAKSVRSTQLATFLMGVAIFFDDYSNCILVGSIMRPLTDRMRISREKLSYIVDSTAAPVAGLSMLSTWIAYEVSTFSAQLPEAGISQSGYAIFLRTIPFRFYCIFTLAFIVLMIVTGRDFGPMLKAERRARSTGETVRPGSRPMVTASMTRIEAKPGVPERWLNAVAPIVFVLLVTVEEFWRIGGGWSRPPSDLFSAQAIREVLKAASDVSPARPIFFGSAAGFVLAVSLLLGQRVLSLKECLKAAAASTRALFFAIVILLLAWCIGGVCSDIGTAHYLIALFKGVIPPLVFPAILFLTSCLVSFSTGSSWSTMSILLPNTVLLAVKISEGSALAPLPMLVISIGAVLEGSIFGDHCSPISDTTILSSVSSAADHMDHVKTQIPYAFFSMSVAIIVGYIPAAAGLRSGWSLLGGVAFLLAGLLLFGRRALPGGRPPPAAVEP